ncbi:F-box/WD repeat-containing protein 5 [Balamuthia mandrillaris]
MEEAKEEEVEARLKRRLQELEKSENEQCPQPSEEEKERRELKRVKLRERVLKHRELMQKWVEKKREEAEQQRLQQEQAERERSTLAEKPFLFIPDEVLLHIFKHLASPRDLAMAARACKRFHLVFHEEPLWEALCKRRYGEDLPAAQLFTRDGKMAWQVTFKNNYFEEKVQMDLLAKYTPFPCPYCGANTARQKMLQRNVTYVHWKDCVSCAKTWDWEYIPLAK